MAGILAPIQDLLDRLKTIEGVNFVHMWNNQFQNQEDRDVYSFPYPCIFLEIKNQAEYGELGLGYQHSDIDWVIHIGQVLYDTAGQMEQNLSIFALRDKVIEKLNLYKPPSCSVLFKTTEEQDYTHTNVYHYIIGFRCGFIDSKGSPEDVDVFDQNYLIKTPPIELEVDVIILP